MIPLMRTTKTTLVSGSMKKLLCFLASRLKRTRSASFCLYSLAYAAAFLKITPRETLFLARSSASFLVRSDWIASSVLRFLSTCSGTMGPLALQADTQEKTTQHAAKPNLICPPTHTKPSCMPKLQSKVARLPHLMSSSFRHASCTCPNPPPSAQNACSHCFSCRWCLEQASFFRKRYAELLVINMKKIPPSYYELNFVVPRLCEEPEWLIEWDVRGSLVISLLSVPSSPCSPSLSEFHPPLSLPDSRPLSPSCRRLDSLGCSPPSKQGMAPKRVGGRRGASGSRRDRRSHPHYQQRSWPSLLWRPLALITPPLPIPPSPWPCGAVC